MRKARIKLLVKLAIFFAVAALVAVMEVGTLTGPHTGSTTSYQALFDTPDGVSGLRDGNSVRVAGVDVGKVTGVAVVDASHSKVTFEANHNQKITNHTWAFVRYANLLGQRFLALSQSGSGPVTGLRSGDSIPATRTRPALSLTTLFNGFRPLFSTLTPRQVNELSQDIIDVLQGQTDRISDLVTRTASLTSNLVSRSATFTTVLDSLSRLLGTVAKHDDQLAQGVVTLHALTNELHADGPAILNSLDAVDRLIGSVGGLFQRLQDRNLPGVISDTASVTGVLAKNTDTLSQLMSGFTAAFATFDRITQNGNWINIYLCNVNVKTYGTVTITLNEVIGALTGFLVPGPIGGLLGQLLNGLDLGSLPPMPVPLKLPNGRVGASTAHTKVCQ